MSKFTLPENKQYCLLKLGLSIHNDLEGMASAITDNCFTRLHCHDDGDYVYNIDREMEITCEHHKQTCRRTDKTAWCVMPFSDIGLNTTFLA